MHGAFSGYIFQRESALLTDEENLFVKNRIEDFMGNLYQRISVLLDFVYDDEEIRVDIQKFANYNFNRTLKNLGFQEVFEGDDIDCHVKVLEEVSEDVGVTMVHDIFSMVGKVYFMMESANYDEKNYENVKHKINTRHKNAPKMRRPV